MKCLHDDEDEELDSEWVIKWAQMVVEEVGLPRYVKKVSNMVAEWVGFVDRGDLEAVNEFVAGNMATGVAMLTSKGRVPLPADRDAAERLLADPNANLLVYRRQDELPPVRTVKPRSPAQVHAKNMTRKSTKKGGPPPKKLLGDAEAERRSAESTRLIAAMKDDGRLKDGIPATPADADLLMGAYASYEEEEAAAAAAAAARPVPAAAAAAAAGAGAAAVPAEPKMKAFSAGKAQSLRERYRQHILNCVMIRTSPWYRDFFGKFEKTRVCKLMAANRATWLKLVSKFVWPAKLMDILERRHGRGAKLVAAQLDMLFYLFEMIGSVLIPEGSRKEGSFGFERFLKIWYGAKSWRVHGRT